jgi:hypothetical protein
LTPSSRSRAAPSRSRPIRPCPGSGVTDRRGMEEPGLRVRFTQRPNRFGRFAAWVPVPKGSRQISLIDGPAEGVGSGDAARQGVGRVGDDEGRHQPPVLQQEDLRPRPAAGVALACLRGARSRPRVLVAGTIPGCRSSVRSWKRESNTIHRPALQPRDGRRATPRSRAAFRLRSDSAVNGGD